MACTSHRVTSLHTVDIDELFDFPSETIYANPSTIVHSLPASDVEGAPLDRPMRDMQESTGVSRATRTFRCQNSQPLCHLIYHYLQSSFAYTSHHSHLQHISCRQVPRSPFYFTLARPFDRSIVFEEPPQIISTNTFKMKGSIAVLAAFAGAALANPMPQAAPAAPSGCAASSPSSFTISVVNVTSSKKRDLENVSI